MLTWPILHGYGRKIEPRPRGEIIKLQKVSDQVYDIRHDTAIYLSELLFILYFVAEYTIDGKKLIENKVLFKTASQSKDFGLVLVRLAEALLKPQLLHTNVHIVNNSLYLTTFSQALLPFKFAAVATLLIPTSY